MRLILDRPRPQRRGNLGSDLLPLPPPPAQNGGLHDFIVVAVVLVHLSPLAVVGFLYVRPAHGEFKLKLCFILIVNSKKNKFNESIVNWLLFLLQDGKLSNQWRSSLEVLTIFPVLSVFKLFRVNSLLNPTRIQTRRVP